MYRGSFCFVLRGSFSHSFGGGTIESVNAGQNCGSMNAVWNILKCKNINQGVDGSAQDFFLTFEDLVSTIETKLNAIKEQYPINKDQLPKVWRIHFSLNQTNYPCTIYKPQKPLIQKQN